MSGCISAAAKNATASAIEEADSQVRLRWAEKWKPALIAEAKSLTEEAKAEAIKQAKGAKDAAISSVVLELEKYKRQNEGRLDKIGVKVENFDTNKDGRVSGKESLELLKEIRKKNSESPNPLEWWEILLAVGAAYVPLTGAKELARKKMDGGAPKPA